MTSCQQSLMHFAPLLLLLFGCAIICHAELIASTDGTTRRADNPQYLVITEDVIPDVENTTQKVIRVNPLDLPALKDDPSRTMDSSLYNIQSLLPAHRTYVNSNRMRRPRPTQEPPLTDSPIIRHLPPIAIEPKPKKPKQQKKKQLHFLYNQADLDGRDVSKTMAVHVAPGAYPVYYAVAKTNGRFGKHPIKGFRNEAEFLKYLLKSKVRARTTTPSLES